MCAARVDSLWKSYGWCTEKIDELLSAYPGIVQLESKNVRWKSAFSISLFWWKDKQNELSLNLSSARSFAFHWIKYAKLSTIWACILRLQMLRGNVRRSGNWHKRTLHGFQWADGLYCIQKRPECNAPCAEGQFCASLYEWETMQKSSTSHQQNFSRRRQWQCMVRSHIDKSEFSVHPSFRLRYSSTRASHFFDINVYTLVMFFL